MRKIYGLIFGMLAVTGLAKADNSFSEIDLTSFQDIPSIIDACDAPIQNVGYSNGQNSRRFYITGLWGVSAATLKQDYATFQQNNTENIFTAGIAGGVSFERQRGRLRLEAEWLQRDFWAAPYEFPPPAGRSRDTVTDNWSVMANLWRDYMFTTKFGCYGGGGIGGGGFTLVNQTLGGPSPGNRGSPPISAFAWQAGGGLIYEINDQVTFDVGYRFYQLNESFISEGFFRGGSVGYSASQVMFSLRMFEPLRSLLR